MNPDRPRFTVVIPTRERGDVLRHALRTVTAQGYADLDILVSDNCSTDGTRDIVAAAADPRIRYVNTDARVSMSKNWEFALSHVASDRYVMVIGDDDGLLPGALDAIAALIAETGADAVSAEFATFIWPDAITRKGARLLVPMRTGHEVRGSRDWLRRTLEGRAWYSELPMLYTAGAIRMSLLDRIRERRGGLLFGSSQPDIFTAVALAATTDRYVFSRRPFAIAGHSRHSNGAAWANHKGGGTERARPNDLFTSEANIPWHDALPVLPSGRIPLAHDLLVYESYLQTRDLHGDPFGFTPQRELAQLLAGPRSDRAATVGWLDDFAARHGLNHALAERDARALRRRLAIHRARGTVRAFRDLYRIEPWSGLAIHDVHDAALVAGTLLRTRPARARSWLGTLRKRVLPDRGHAA